MSQIIQLMVYGLANGAILALAALGFVLIYKATSVINFAQGEFLLVGAWFCWWVVTDLGLPFWIGFPATLVFMTIFGVLIQVVVLRPLIGEPIISIIMVTIGLGIFFQAMMNWIFGVFAQPFPPIFETETISIFGLNVETAYMMSLAISIVIMIAFAYFFKYSNMGLAMRATAFDQQVAQSLGVSIKQVFAISWAISAVVSAVAGVVIGIVNGVSSSLAFIGIKVFPAVIVGGLESIVGAIVGGLIIGVLENMAQFVDSEILHWGNMFTIAPFYVLIIILMIKPYGLFGVRDIERV
ncbi:MAG: branched-chain amino acid ABC transporter permease [Minwuiales bacterium]|nr:branched-chain amino acid ABC transporter permease [Minwuiales bacterium]